MRKRKRRTVPEINLTPLLDVLFSILFIVMMTGMQNEKGLKEDYRGQIDRLEQENSELSEKLKISERQLSSYEIYRLEAVILTLYNETKDGKHYLVIRQGLKETESERILLGEERMENVKTRINELIKEFAGKEDKQPVYIVFYCDKDDIYTTEFRVITDTFQKLQSSMKEVFFKVMEE